MEGTFAKNFVTKLNGKISDDNLKVVLQELEIFVNDYSIENRRTELISYENIIPHCYKVYMISKKIEGLSSGTLKIYDLYLKDFFSHIEKPLEQITANDIRAYLYQLQQRRKISNHSLDGKRLVINTFLEWCKNEEYISKNPCKQIQPIRFEEKPREPLSDIELELVRYGCKTYRDKAIIELFYSTGCRVSEMVNLNKGDIDFDTGEVHLFGKGSKHRISYVNAKAEVALKRYLAARKDNNQALIVSERAPYQRLSKTGIERAIRIIGEHSKIGRNLYPHLIRHTTATDALNRGMNVTEVQKILGHEKLDTTMIYAKVSQENVRYNHKRYIV
ncbi:site-specific tyrosine recombinase/integron integrase [Lachnospiraceae bacterium 42-17]